jgi:hypothetical protein
MRKAVAWELVSLDGVMETPEEWAFSYSNDEMAKVQGAGIGGAIGFANSLARSPIHPRFIATCSHDASEHVPQKSGGGVVEEYIIGDVRVESGAGGAPSIGQLTSRRTRPASPVAPRRDQLSKNE